MSDLDNIIAATGAKKTSHGWMGHCPAHDDRTPSLSISEGGNGKVLFKCMAGCSQLAVIDALDAKGAWQATSGKSGTTTPEEREKAQSDQLWKDRLRHAKAEKVAADIKKNAKGDPNQHPYVVRKKCYNPRILRGFWPQRKWDDTLLIPIYAPDGRTVSIQAINTNGEKDFLAGGRTKGCFHPIGMIRGATGPVVIGEGLATVAAVCAVTGCPGVVAMSAGNLEPVAKVIKELAPDADIIIVADNDQKGDSHE